MNYELRDQNFCQTPARFQQQESVFGTRRPRGLVANELIGQSNHKSGIQAVELAGKAQGPLNFPLSRSFHAF